MPALVRKLVVGATVDGLVLQPVKQHHQRAIPSLLIRYSTNEIVSLSSQSCLDVASRDLLEAHGVVGTADCLFTVASVSYVILISQRNQVTQIRGVPIYVITDVALIPLTSQSDARNAIIQCIGGIIKETSSQRSRFTGSSDSSEDDEDYHEDIVLQDDSIPCPGSSSESTSGTPATSSDKSTSIARDVLSQKGEYGRFADKWFSRKGWRTERMRVFGMSTGEDTCGRAQDLPAVDTFKSCHRSLSIDKPIPADEDSSPKYNNSTPNEIPPNLKDSSFIQSAVSSNPKEIRSSANEVSSNQDAAHKFLPKLLRTTRILLCSRSFFFSYDYDITKRLGFSENTKSDIPFQKSVDPLFFWNRHLARSLIDGGHHAFVLPLIQGFVGQQAFTIKSVPRNPFDATLANDLKPNKAEISDTEFLITLISRRFITRPGLRYLRRGIDDEGSTANCVETEQLLSKPSWAPGKVCSFTQIRGSIPLFFSQSPYSLKPVPMLQHSYEMNHTAFRRHFKGLATRYGALQVASLVDKTGGEAEIGEQYEMHMKQLNNDGGIGGAKVGFEYFDFHEKCRGFHYGNISVLMELLRETMDSFGTTVEIDGVIQTKQNGILRINCMDCLDRTNVAQSACAQIALQKQLREEGFETDLQNDRSTEWFNVLWADNGDAISKQYSSTAALKGDYTRTRKRNYRGAINDFGLTLSRYYHNIVDDYFSQAAIDFLTGNVTSQVFEEFELNMMSSDPAISMEKLRANAIDTSTRIVVIDQDEDFIEGWILLSPQQPNTVRTFPFEETVLLLTNVALYAVRFDWNMEKVSSFERVHLQGLTGITRGTYITSILTSTQINENKNVGLMIKYRPTKEDITRTNTRSLRNTANSVENAENNPEKSSNLIGRGLKDFMTNRTTARDISSAPKILAFKAIAARSSLASAGTQVSSSEKEVVDNICHTIEKAVMANAELPHIKYAMPAVTTLSFIENQDIISLQEARKSTGLLEQWGHMLKRLVWA